MKLDVQNGILIVLVLALLLTVFSMSALALSDFVSPLELNTPVVYALPNNNTLKLFSSDVGDVYIFGVGKMLYLASSQSGNVSLGMAVNIVPPTGSDSPIQTYDSSTGLYYLHKTTISSTSSFNPDTVPVFSSLDDALSALSDFIEGQNPPPSPVAFDYTLPPGNIAYIPLPTGASENITYTLTTTYYMAFGNNDTSRINQVVTVYSTLPSSSNNTAPSSPKIPWTNNGNVNLLGVSANKIYNGSIPSNLGGQYLVVANPLTMPSQGGSIGGDTYINGSITIHVSNVGGNPYIYPMSESLTITVGDGIGSESTYGDVPYTYVTDPDTGEIVWTDPNGGDSAPVSGGNNPLPSPNTIFDWLRNISQQLADFLRGPVQAVQTVVSAIRDFLSSFTQLYMWLPSPVYSLITSALMIAITIGVIKIFV